MKTTEEIINFIEKEKENVEKIMRFVPNDTSIYAGFDGMDRAYWIILNFIKKEDKEK